MFFSLRNLLKKVLRFLKGPPKSYFYMADNPAYSKYSIGRYTYGNPLVLDYGSSTLKIGSFCSISSDVTIMLGGNHRSDWVTTYPFNVIFEEFHSIQGHPSSKGDVVIGNDVWIGYGALILSGVTIADGAVVGARSVVTKNIEAYSIVAGNPAKFIKWRFPEAQIAELEATQWWNWDLEKIKQFVPLMLSHSIDPFIQSASGSKSVHD